MKLRSTSLLCGMFAIALGGCAPLSVGLAVANLVSGAASAPPPEAPPPGTQIMQALAGVDTRVSESCERALDAWQAAQEATPQATTPDAVSAGTCGIRPICLPGASNPVDMMVCDEGAGAAVSTPTPVGDPASASGTDPAWSWAIAGQTD